MKMVRSSQEVYEKFVNFCSISLKGENPKFLDLIKSRYEGCDEIFRSSDEMISILEKTQRNMTHEESRKFVHLKILLTELKINTSARRGKKIKKRKHSSDSCTESEHVDKVPKLKDCSVVVEKVPNDDTSLCDHSLDGCLDFDTRKSCFIADGNTSSALNIVVADLRDELGSDLQCYIVSPINNWKPTTSRNTDSSKNTFTHPQGVIYDSDSTSTSHLSGSFREKLPRKYVSIVSIDNIADECCIRSGTLSCIASDNPSNPHINSDVKESESWQVESEHCGFSNTDYKTHKHDSTLKTANFGTESQKGNSTCIVDDVKLSYSPDLLIIESSSCEGHLKECLNAKVDNRTPQLDCAHSNIAETLAIASEESLHLGKDSIHSVLSYNKSDDLSSFSSAIISYGSDSEALSGTILGKLSSEKSLLALDLATLGALVSTNTARCEGEKALELQDLSGDVDQSSVNYKDNIGKQKCVAEISVILKSQDSSTVAAKDNIDKKTVKRVSLLPTTKTAASTSSNVFVVKSYTHSSQERIAQDSKSISTDFKAGSSCLSGEKMLETGCASADEFQEKDISLDKSKIKQRRIIKLERLLGSLRDEIEKCQNSEMSLEDLDDENAAYIYEDKLKRKFVAAWNKLCEITGRSFTTGRPTERTIRYSGTRYKEINRRIEKFLNKKKMFPDFHDIKSIIKLTNKKCDLNLNSMMVNDISREAFVDIGEMLQTRRHQDFISTFGTRQTDILRTGMDPYLADPELRRKMDNNRQLARSNLDSVIAKYAKLQYDRHCGDDGKAGDEEEEEADNNDNDEVDKKTRNIQAESRGQRKNKAPSKDVEDFVTTASIEVDTAEEEDESISDLNSCDTGSITQEHPVDYNPKAFSSKQSSHLIPPGKYKHTSEKTVNDSNVSTETLVSSKEITHAVTVGDNSTKNRLDSWKATVNKNPHYLDVQENNIEVITSKQENAQMDDLSNPDKKNRNIKFTARKPLFPNSELVENTDCSEISEYVGSKKANSELVENTDCSNIPECVGSKKTNSELVENTDCLEISEFVGSEKTNSELVENTDCLEISEFVGCKKQLSYTCENFETNVEDNNDSDEEEEDQSSDSTSEKDSDDKSVDDDVDEIVMIISGSESECGSTSSSRSPSPVSVVFLSSDSLDNLSGNDECNEEIVSAIKTSADDKKILHVKESGKHKHDECENSSLEKRLFLHAMGMQKMETEAYDLADEKLYRIDKKDNTDLRQVGDDEQQTACKQAHSVIGLNSRAVNKEGSSTSEKDCFIVQDSSSSLERKIRRDSDDCIIINDTPRKADHIKDTLVDFQKFKMDKQFSLHVGESIGIHGGQTKLESMTSTISLDLLSEGYISNAAEAACESSTQNDQEINKPEKEMGDLIQNKLENLPNKEFINTEISTKEIGVKINLQSAVRHSIMEEEFKHSTAQNILSNHMVQTVSACEMKDEREEIDKSSECAAKSNALIVNESLSVIIKDMGNSSDVLGFENMIESEIITNSVCHNLKDSAAGENIIPSNGDTRIQNNTTSVKQFNAERNQPTDDTEQALLQDTSAVDDIVITLNDRSVDNLCCEDSSPNSQLPLHEENSSHVEKNSPCNANETVENDHPSFQDSCNQIVSDCENLGSCKEITEVLQADVQESHENYHTSPIPVPNNNYTEDKLISNVISTAQNMVTYLECGQSESEQYLSALNAESALTSVHKRDNLNLQDFIGCSSDCGELRPKSEGENFITENSEDGEKNVIVCDDIRAACSKHVVRKEAAKDTDQEVATRGNCLDEISNSNDIVGTLREEVHTSRAGLDSSEASKKMNYQNTGKQSLKNLSQDLFEDSSVFEVFSDNGVEEAENVTELTVNAGLHNQSLLQPEGHASLKSKQTDECFLHLKGSDETCVFAEKQGLQHVSNQSTISLCDVRGTKDTLGFINGEIERYVCRSFEDVESTNKNISTEHIHAIRERDGSDKIDVITSSDHSKYRSGGDMLPEKVKTACNINRNDGDIMLHENIADKETDVLHNRVIHMSTSQDKNVDGTIIRSIENEPARVEHVLVDEKNKGNEESMIIDTLVEDAESDTQLKVNPPEVVSDDSVDLLIFDSQTLETVVENCVLHSISSASTRTDYAGNTSDLDSESEEPMCSLDLDIVSKELAVQSQRNDSISTPQNVLVISHSQSSISQDADTAEVEESGDFNLVKVIHTGERTTVDNSMVKASLSSDKEGTANISEGNDERQEVANHFNQKELMTATNSEINSIEHIHLHVSDTVYTRKHEDTVRVLEHTESGIITEHIESGSITEQTESGSITEQTESGIITEQTESGSITEQTESGIITEQTESGSITEQTETASLADEDEIRIIEELSSVKGIRCSENSKEDDRKLVDQLLLDIELNQSKEVKFPSGSNSTLAAACSLSGECWDISENEGSTEGPSSSHQKMIAEKSDCSLITNSLYHSSVLSVECDEVDTSEEKLSPPSTLVPQAASSVVLPAQVTKRTYDESVSGRLSSKAGEHAPETENDISKCAIDVEVLPLVKKQKVVNPDFITDIISSVLSEFPAGGQTKNLSSLAKNNKPHSKGKIGSDTMASSSKNAAQGAYDDEDVVIMDETPPNNLRVLPVSLNKNLSPAAFKKHTPTSSSLEKLENPATRPFQHKKHLELWTSSSSHHLMHSVPSSFHSQSQVPSSNFRRSSVTSQNQPPLQLRVKDSLTASNYTIRTSSLGMASSSQPLPRLMPRVPIPSIQTNKTSEFARTHPKHQDCSTVVPNISRRQSQFSASGRVNPSPSGYSEIRMRPNVSNVRPHVSNSSVSRNKTSTPIMVPPNSRGRSGVTSTGRLNPYSKQSNIHSGVPNNNEKYKIQPSHHLQISSVQHHAKVNSVRGRDKHQKLDGMEIILGDSDDEADFNNASSGLRIVSVASLSTHSDLNIASGDHNIVSATRVQGQACNGVRDTIIIPD